MRKPLPFDATDVPLLARWLGEMRELTTELHATALDATSKERVHSRKELRRRMCKLTKRLHALLDAVQPASAEPVAASSSPREEPRLTSAA